MSGNAALKQLYCNECHLTFVDVSGNSLSKFESEGNVYAITSDTTINISDLPNGFDPSKVSEVKGADFTDGIFSNFTEETVTYTYDCGSGYSVSFTLLVEGFVEGYVEINE